MQVSLLPFIRKEMLHILRDRRTMLVVIAIPLLLIFLFGFTVSTDVRDIRIAVCAPVRSHTVEESVNRLAYSPYFTFRGYMDPSDIDRSLRRGDVSAVVVFAGDYASSGNYQILLDGADVNTAATSEIFIRSVIQDRAGAASPVRMHMIYNPGMKSAYNFVPGLLGMILLLICTMMTSVSIVKEKETGTMEVLLVSPVKPIYIIISKMIPYLLFGCLDLALILLLARYALGVPLSGGVLTISLVSILYIILALSLGMMVSNVADSQITALLISAMVMMMPVLFFSGLLFPINNLPWVLRWISYVIPARWYIDAMRKMMIEGVGLGGVLLETGILLMETIVLIAASTKKFNDRLQ